MISYHDFHRPIVHFSEIWCQFLHFIRYLSSLSSLLSIMSNQSITIPTSMCTPYCLTVEKDSTVKLPIIHNFIYDKSFFFCINTTLVYFEKQVFICKFKNRLKMFKTSFDWHMIEVRHQIFKVKISTFHNGWISSWLKVPFSSYYFLANKATQNDAKKNSKL